jgi:hypothetical protein
MIDRAFAKGQKPRGYRRIARRDYLRYAKNRRPSLKLLRKSLRKQLSYVARNPGYLLEVKENISVKDQEQFRVIEVLYAQQKQMYEKGSKRVEDRIVSLLQPWVRPIVRGKAKAAVEFGSKMAILVFNTCPGITFMRERLYKNLWKTTVRTLGCIRNACWQTERIAPERTCNTVRSGSSECWAPNLAVHPRTKHNIVSNCWKNDWNPKRAVP